MSLMLWAVAASTALACLLGVKTKALKATELRSSLGQMLEWSGAVAVFMLVNLGIAALITAASRAIGPGFMSAYVLGDFTMPVLSLLQATLFQLWHNATVVRLRDGQRD